MPICNCAYCEKEFYRIPSALKGHKNHFCSRECGDKFKIGKKHSKETKKKIGLGNKGKFVSRETRRRISEARKGKKYGFHISKKAMKKLRRINLKEGNPNWKGNKAKQSQFHIWLRKHYKAPKYCEFCGKEKKLDLANLSETYTRDINNYEWLCRKCHLGMDTYTKQEREEFGLK
jgi:hypothetical protein